MIDQKILRKDLETVVGQLKHRGFDFDVELYSSLEKKRKLFQASVQELQAKRNTLSKEIGKNQTDNNLKEEAAEVAERLDKAERDFEGVQEAFQEFLMNIPNLPHKSVPQGNAEEDNVIVDTWGEPKVFDFQVKDHVDLGQLGKDRIDFASAIKLTGSRFSVLRGEVAALHRALAQFMLDVHIHEHGYEEAYVPYIVNQSALFGTGQLPKFEEDQFSLASDDGWYLIPTAEVPLTNLYKDSILNEEDLPISMVAHTPCFRREAGSYGRDTRGLIRQHQFDKVELVKLVHPDDAWNQFDLLLSHAEAILRKLELPYRSVALCGGDLGFSSMKTIDLEVWMPASGVYREISSCSNFGDFQARRMKARYRKGKEKPSLLHTLNGSGLAVGRTLVAVMENYQDSHGTIAIPAALIPYMRGKTHI